MKLLTWRHRTNQLLQRSAGGIWERTSSNLHALGLLHEEQARILRRAINAHFSSSVVENTSNQIEEQQETTTTTANFVKDEFINNTLPALKIIAESFGLLKKNPAFQNWTSADWLLGLTVLAQHNTMEKKKKNNSNNNKQNVVSVLSPEKENKRIIMKKEKKKLVEDLLHYVRICDAVYANTIDNFCQEANYTKENIIRIHNGGVFSPKFILLKDDTRQEVILVVRGSASILDFCTDLCLVNEPFQDGQGHRGIVHAADWLVKNIKGDLQKLLEKNPAYKIVLTGHSLGAGVAALATIEMKPFFENFSMHCIGFATPASVTIDLAVSCYDNVTTIVNGDDCVPRLHQHSMLKLQEQVSCFDWRHTLKQMIKEEVYEQKMIAKQKQNEKLDEILQAFKNLQDQTTLQQAKKKIQQVNEKINASVQKALFKMDQHSQKHVHFLKKMIDFDEEKQQQQQQQYQSITTTCALWWGRVDASVVALEKIADLVEDPKQKQLLIEQSTALMKAVNVWGDQLQSTVGDFSPHLKTFAGRIDSVVNKMKSSEMVLRQKAIANQEEFVNTITSVSSELNAKMEAQVDEVTDALQNQVEKQLNVVREDFKEAQDIITSTVQETNATIDSMLEDLQLETMDMMAFFSHEDHHTLTSSITSREENFEEEEEDDDDELDESFNDLQALTHHHKRPQMTAEDLCHEPLFPPGRIIYLNHVASTSTTTSSSSSTEVEQVELYEVTNEDFNRVLLSNDMIKDHLCTNYEAVLKNSSSQMMRMISNKE